MRKSKDEWTGYKIWGFHNGDYKDCRLVGCDAVWILRAATCSCWFLARGFFYPEDGGDTFLRNVCSHKIYTRRHIPEDSILQWTGCWRHSKSCWLFSMIFKKSRQTKGVDVLIWELRPLKEATISIFIPIWKLIRFKAYKIKFQANR
jgi:hypothetical protein